MKYLKDTVSVDWRSARQHGRLRYIHMDARLLLV